jgi:hypothetical protein
MATGAEGSLFNQRTGLTSAHFIRQSCVGGSSFVVPLPGAPCCPLPTWTNMS